MNRLYYDEIGLTPAYSNEELLEDIYRETEPIEPRLRENQDLEELKGELE